MYRMLISALAFSMCIAGCEPLPCSCPEEVAAVEAESTEGALDEGAPEVKEGEAQEAAEGEAIEGEPLSEGQPEGIEGGSSENESSTVACLGDCSYRIVNTYCHDRAAFTQGLQFEDGVLYEGTGEFCCSQLRRVELATGKVLKAVNIAEDFCMEPLQNCNGAMTCSQAASVFGEGITIFGGRIIQLTWQDCIAFVYDKETMTFQSSFTYNHQGWGITHDGARLIISDGTDTIRFYDPFAYVEVGSIQVRDNGAPVRQLNELEYIQGHIWANVWQTDRIVKIDPATGNVVAKINLAGILPAEDRQPTTDVLNGIAYDAANDRLFVTGKRWPKLFEIALVQQK